MKIEQLPMPSKEDIVDRRITQFKDLISSTIESEDLGAFESIIGSYQQHYDTDINEVAAALAFLVQRDRPLSPDIPSIPEPNSERKNSKTGRAKKREASVKSPSREQSKKPNKSNDSVRPIEAGMDRYRIAVGHEHDAMPKNIVGAIANEAGLDSEHIGYIKINDTYSTIDLPEEMPVEIFKHLQNVYVCGQKLRIALDGEKSDDSRKNRHSKSDRSGSKSAKKDKKKPKKPKKNKSKRKEKEKRD